MACCIQSSEELCYTIELMIILFFISNEMIKASESRSKTIHNDGESVHVKL